MLRKLMVFFLVLPSVIAAGQDIGAKINADGAATGWRGTIFIPDGTYDYSTTIAPTLNEMGGFTLRCSSKDTILNYTGSGDALYLYSPEGAVFSGVNIENCTFEGSSSQGNANGIHTRLATGVNFYNVKVDGFPGDNFLNEGSNTINAYSMHLQSAGRNNVHNVGYTTASGAHYNANAIRLFGGALGNAGNWNWYEDGSYPWGRNQNNGMSSGIIEAQQGNTSNGEIFIENCDSCSFDRNYIEAYGVVTWPNLIVIGNVANSGLGANNAQVPTGTVFRDNFLSSGGATTVFNILNADHPQIEGNDNVGFAQTWIAIGSGVGNAVIGSNRAGDDRITGTATSSDQNDVYGLVTNFPNAHHPTGLGYYYRQMLLGGLTALDGLSLAPGNSAPGRRGITWGADPSGDITFWFNTNQYGAGIFFKNGNDGSTAAQITNSGLAAPQVDATTAFSLNGVIGYTGTKTIGTCTLVINGGIITDVVGC